MVIGMKDYLGMKTSYCLCHVAAISAITSFDWHCYLSGLLIYVVGHIMY